MSGKMGQAIEHTLRSYPGLQEWPQKFVVYAQMPSIYRNGERLRCGGKKHSCQCAAIANISKPLFRSLSASLLFLFLFLFPFEIVLSAKTFKFFPNDTTQSNVGHTVNKGLPEWQWCGYQRWAERDIEHHKTSCDKCR